MMGLIIILAITATRRRPAKKKSKATDAYKRLHKKIVDSMITLLLIEKWEGCPLPFVCLLANASLRNLQAKRQPWPLSTESLTTGNRWGCCNYSLKSIVAIAVAYLPWYYYLFCFIYLPTPLLTIAATRAKAKTAPKIFFTPKETPQQYP